MRYYFISVGSVEPQNLAVLKAWVVEGPPQGIRIEVKNRGSDPLFIDWTRSQIELPRYGKRGIRVQPSHKYSAVAGVSVFELRPAGPAPAGSSSSKSKSKSKALFPPSTLEKGKKAIIRFELMVCSGIFIDEELPPKCGKGSSAWRSMVSVASVRVLPKKRSVSKKKRK